MTTDDLFVSIGLPVRNGEPWLPHGCRCQLEFARRAGAGCGVKRRASTLGRCHVGHAFLDIDHPITRSGRWHEGTRWNHQADRASSQVTARPAPVSGRREPMALSGSVTKNEP
jgi:hypothetical protein